MKLIISDVAEFEIEDIWYYIVNNFGVKVAIDKMQKFYKDLYKLVDNPYMGKSVDGHDENLRQFYCAPNMVIYDINDEVIEILHVVDARTDYARLVRCPI